MRSLFTYISGLLAAFVLFLQLWRFAPLDRALLMAGLTGIGAFGVLYLGYVAIRWILARTPSRNQAAAPPQETSSDHAETESPKPAPMTTPATV